MANVDRDKVWITGFQRKHTAAQLKKVAELLLARVPALTKKAVIDSEGIRAQNLASTFTIRFPSVREAADFVSSIREAPFVWEEPRCGATRILARHDRTAQESVLAQGLGRLWKLAYDELSRLGKWQGIKKMGTTRSGTLYVTLDDDDPWVLFNGKFLDDSQTLEFTPVLNEVTHFGISHEKAYEMAKAAAVIDKLPARLRRP